MIPIMPDTSGSRPQVTLSANIKVYLEQSICRFAPEHYAILLGNPDKDPLHVVDAAVVPPLVGSDGRFDRSSTHIRPNPSVIEYFLNTLWLPRGLYPIGLIHTHPGSMDTLSGTSGDLGALRKMLANAHAQNRPLPHVIAPIINLDRADGVPRFTGWIVQQGDGAPIRADLKWLPDEIEQPATRLKKIFELLEQFRADVKRLREYEELPKSLANKAQQALAVQLREDLSAIKTAAAMPT